MIIEELLAYNKQFVAEKRYEQYDASKSPNKKIAILTCMDTRLVELLPAALCLLPQPGHLERGGRHGIHGGGCAAACAPL